MSTNMQQFKAWWVNLWTLLFFADDNYNSYDYIFHPGLFQFPSFFNFRQILIIGTHFYFKFS